MEFTSKGMVGSVVLNENFVLKNQNPLKEIHCKRKTLTPFKKGIKLRSIAKNRCATKTSGSDF